MWLVCAISAAILWGLNYAVAEKILYSISPLTLLALEMLAGAVLFFIVSYFFDLKTDMNILSTQPSLVLLTVFEIIVVLAANLLIAYSIQLKDGTTVGIIELIYPLFTILFSWILFRTHHLSPSIIIGGALIIIGVFIISIAW